MAYESILRDIANPKPSNYLASYMGGVEARSALDEQQRQGQARQLAGRALTGDKAAGQQLAQVAPQVFMELRKFQGDERAKELERVGGLYYRADTPEKWQIAMDHLKRAGYDMSEEDMKFENRESLLGLAMTAAQQIALEHQNRQFAFEQQKFAADQDYKQQSLGIEREKLARTIAKGDPQERALLAQTFGLQPGTPEYQSYVLTGKMPLPQKGKEGLSATQLRFKRESEENLSSLENTITVLGQAKALLEQGVDEGMFAGARTMLGSKAPGIAEFVGVDPKLANRSFEANQILSIEAIQQMASTLKGATTDFELNKFVGLLADPATPNNIKRQTLDRMMQLAKRKQAMEQDRLASPDLGGQGQVQQSKPEAEQDIPVGATAVNPQTGKRIRWNGQDWEPVQ